MKFRKKPVVIDAIQYIGKGQDSTSDECRAFCGTDVFSLDGDTYDAFIRTLEGDMRCSDGDWIIKGVNGEFYPCKPDIFEKTYEAPLLGDITVRDYKEPETPVVEAFRIVRESEYTDVMCADEPGAGGACHEYQIMKHDMMGASFVEIDFQNGPIQEKGVNGVQNEDLLAIVIDRLEGFQSGEFASPLNQDALTCCKAALHNLELRTYDRKKRGVEGKSEA